MNELQTLEELNNFKKYEENRGTLITLYFYKIKKEEVLHIITKELNKVSTIQNVSVKQKLNDRLYNLKIIVEKIDDNCIINSLFLLENEVYEYKFTQKDIQIFIEYKLRNFYIKKDSIFDIDYITDLFNNFEFNYCCQITKNLTKFSKINMNKNKVIMETKFLNEKSMIEIINTFLVDHKINDLLVYGINNNIKCLINEKNNKLIIKNEEMTNEDIINLFSTRKYDFNNELLEKRLNDLDNPKTNLDVYVFGKLKKEIVTSIEYYQLKELYIEERKIEILKQFIDESYLNFTIIPIKVIKNGDIADQFINNYNGLMGIKYY
jgi:hypothetical protein